MTGELLTKSGPVIRETLARAMADPYQRAWFSLLIQRTGVLAAPDWDRTAGAIDPLRLAYDQGMRQLGYELLELLDAVDPGIFPNILADSMGDEGQRLAQARADSLDG